MRVEMHWRGWRRCGAMHVHCWAGSGSPTTMEHSFEKLLGRLAEGDVRFILVGGLAVALHGYVRLTEDVC